MQPSALPGFFYCIFSKQLSDKQKSLEVILHRNVQKEMKSNEG